MRTMSVLIFLSLLLASCAQQEEQPAAPVSLYDQIRTDSTAYDSLMAARLGGDEYGMKPYVMAFLKQGPRRDQDSITAAALQKAHLENINRMAEEGSLVMAGPFLDEGEVRGIYIFDVADVEAARALTSTDPAIQAGRLEMELHPWYGPATLPLLTPLYNKVARRNVAK